MKIPAKGFLKGHTTKGLAIATIAAAWAAYAFDAPVFDAQPLELGETILVTIGAAIAYFMRRGIKSVEEAVAKKESSDPPAPLKMSSIALFLCGAVAIGTVAGCSGKIARDEILGPAIRLAADGIRDEVYRGIADAVADQDLTQVEAEGLHSSAAGLWFAIAQNDRAAVAERLPVWATLRPFAERGIQDMVEDVEIGAGGAAGRIERLNNFEEALNRIAERL